MDVFKLVASLGLDTKEYDEKLGDSGSKFEAFGKKITGAFKAIAGAVVVKKAIDGVVNLGKAAVSAYGEFEQLSGGIETLYKSSSSKMMAYAEEAYKTAGMSANEYMSTAIESSAAMINSLGGDTAKAADLTNQAIIDMSDNVNKMGTSMEGVQNAYRGFSRGNFTMLDNLALGFAGTKEGMQQLLDKATELSGVKYDIGSYADIVQAIHVVQTEMGITGTTAKEAADTIEGSMKASKAAWKDLLTAMGRGQDVKKATKNLISSFKNVLKNVIPTVKRIIPAIGEALVSLGPAIAAELPEILGYISPSLQTFAVNMGNVISKGFATVKDLFAGIVDKAKEKFDLIKSYFDTNLIQPLVTLWNNTLLPVFAQAEEALGPLKKSFADTISVIKGIFNGTQSFGDLTYMFKDLKEKFLGFVESMKEILSHVDWLAIGQQAWEIVKSAFAPAAEWFKGLFESAKERIKGINWGEAGGKIWAAIKNGFAVVNGWLLKLVLGDDWTPESGWGDAGAKIWETIKNGFAAAKDWLFKLVLGDEWTPDAGWGTVGAKIWETIKNGFAVVNGWLLQLVLGEDYTPDAGWGDVGAKIWAAIKNGFAVTGDWIKATVLGDEYTPESSWADVGAKIWNKIVEGLGSYVDWLKSVYESWTAKLTEIDFESIGISIWTAISNAFAGVAEWFKNLFGGEDEGSVFNSIESIDWLGLGTAILDFIKSAFTGIGEIFKGIFEGIVTSVKEIDWVQLGTDILDFIKTAFNAVSSWFTGKFNAAKEAIKQINWAEVKDTVWTALSDIGDKLKGAFDTAKTRIQAIPWSEVRTTIWDRIKALGGNLKDNFETAKNNIKSLPWAEVKNTVWDKIKDVASWFKNSFETKKGEILKIDWKGMAGKIWDKIKQGFQKVTEFFSDLFDFSNIHIKMPHFSVTWELVDLGLFGQHNMPNIGVEWYKKAYNNPLMFTRPTIIPTMNGLKGFGDGAGAEIVLSESKLRQLAGGTTNNFNIYQQPGESAEALADRVERVLTRREQQRRAVYST